MRRITAVRVNTLGFITDVKGDDWSQRTARHVIEDIEMGIHAYNAYGPDSACVVYTLNEGAHVFLSAAEPDTTTNVLLALPRF